MLPADLPSSSPAYYQEYCIPSHRGRQQAIPHYSTPHYSTSIPKTQLFLDVNWTVTCLDSYGYAAMNDEQILAVLTIDVARQIVGVWPDGGAQPTTYYAYVEKQLYPDDPSYNLEQRLALYKKRDAEYAQLFSRLSEPEKTYWLAKVALAQEKFKSLRKSDYKVFNSLVKLVDQHKNDKSFQLILRTFGKDGPAVMQEVNERVGYDFFNMKLYKLSYLDAENFCLKLEGSPDEIIPKKQLSARLYQLGNCVVQDDFDTWYKEGMVRNFGKAFPLDKNPKLKRFFVDDYAWQKTILFPFDAETGKPLELSEKQVPHITTIDMLLDDDALLKIVGDK